MARAAKTFRWRGTADTNWRTPGNWVDDAGTAQTVDFPGYDGALTTNVDGDEVLFDAAATNGVAGGEQATYGALASLVISDEYDKGVGSAESSLGLVMAEEASPVIIDAAHAGAIYLTSTDGTAGLGSVRVTASKGTTTLDGTLPKVAICKGKVVLAATASISALSVAYMEQPATDATVTIAAGATLPSLISVAGGQITNNATVSTVIQAGGTWTHSAASAVQMLILSGGTFNWDRGDLGSADVYAGTLDASRTLEPRAATLIRLYRQGRLRTSNAQTAGWTIETYGGSIEFTPGQRLVQG